MYDVGRRAHVYISFGSVSSSEKSSAFSAELLDQQLNNCALFVNSLKKPIDNSSRLMRELNIQVRKINKLLAR